MQPTVFSYVQLYKILIIHEYSGIMVYVIKWLNVHMGIELIVMGSVILLQHFNRPYNFFNVIMLITT